jgi:hypothetical protein
MREEPVRLPMNVAARLAGCFYLLYILTFSTTTWMQSKPIAWSNGNSTAEAIRRAPEFFRAGVALEVLSSVLFFLAAWALYVVFKRVNGELAILFLLLNSMGVAVECVCAAFRIAVFEFYNGADYLKALSTDQLNTLALLGLKIAGSGGMVNVLLFGLWLFPLGYQVVKSRMMPKVFGILLLIDGACLMICFFQLWLLPGYQRWTHPLYPIMFIAEFGLGAWLALRGVKEPIQLVERVGATT